MEKLLHERLREYECEMCYFPCDNGYLADITPYAAEALADEIERYYAPLPRDNEGIPYHIGDTVYSVDPETEYSAEIVGINASGTIRILWEDGSTDYCDPSDIQHERPQSKVLDADGVEINVGDTVWVIGGADDGKKLTVHSFVHSDGGKTYVSCGEKGVCRILRSPSDLTHKEPDSLESIRNDIKRYIDIVEDQYSIEKVYPLDEWADRLSSLIERGA